MEGTIALIAASASSSARTFGLRRFVRCDEERPSREGVRATLSVDVEMEVEEVWFEAADDTDASLLSGERGRVLVTGEIGVRGGVFSLSSMADPSSAFASASRSSSVVMRGAAVPAPLSLGTWRDMGVKECALEEREREAERSFSSCVAGRT